jgi:hypothetical protein
VQRPLGGGRRFAAVEIECCGGKCRHRARHRETYRFGAGPRSRSGPLGFLAAAGRKE